MWILFLLVIVPLAELTLLIEVGSLIGALPTLTICLATAFVGGTLARRQGMTVLNRIRWSVARGEMPAGQMIHGAMILLAGAMLFVPGFLSDVIGLSLLVPPVRRVVGGVLIHRYRGRVHTTGPGFHPHDTDIETPLFLPPGSGPQATPKKPQVIIVDDP